MELLWHKTDGVDDNYSFGESFDNETTIIKKTPARSSQPALPPPNPNESQPTRPQKPPIALLNTKVTIPLKYLSDFLRSQDLY